MTISKTISVSMVDLLKRAGGNSRVKRLNKLQGEVWWYITSKQCGEIIGNRGQSNQALTASGNLMDSIVSKNEHSSLFLSFHSEASNSPRLPTTCLLFRKICQVLFTRNNVTHFPLLHRFAFTFNLFRPYTCSTSSFPARR